MTRRDLLEMLAIAAIALAAFIAGEWLMSRGKLPPPTVRTLPAFLAWAEDDVQFVVLEGEPPHLMALGPSVGMLPSGPSAHVFDADGRLVDSTRDLGDSGSFKRRWDVRYPLTIKSRAIAEQWAGEDED